MHACWHYQDDLLKFKHQTGEERWSNRSLTWSEYFRNCDSTGIFPCNHLWGIQRTVQKREISSESQFSALLVSELRGELPESFGLLGAVNQITKVCRRASQNIQHVKTWSSWAMAAEDQTSSLALSPLLPAKNRKLGLQFAWTHQNSTIEDWKRMLPALVNLF